MVEIGDRVTNLVPLLVEVVLVEVVVDVLEVDLVELVVELLEVDLVEVVVVAMVELVKIGWLVVAVVCYLGLEREEDMVEEVVVECERFGHQRK